MKRCIYSAVLLLFVAFTFNFCTKKETPTTVSTQVDDGFKTYVTAYTSGTIKSGSKLRVELSSAVKQNVAAGEKAPSDLFTFKPDIQGEAVWISPNIIEFTPSEALKSGQLYKGDFHLSKLVEVKSELSKLPLVVQVIKQSFQIEPGMLKPASEDDQSIYTFEGALLTADEMDDDKVESLVSATQEGASLKISWQHNVEENKHLFFVEGIQRKDSDGEISLQWDGAAQSLEEKGERLIEIPGQSNFKITDVKVFHLPEQYLQIAFSEVLKPGQNLSGLIRLANSSNLKYTMDGNTIKVFPAVRLAGKKEIQISRSIRDSENHRMLNDFVQEITFEVMKPKVRLLGKGIIMPDADGLSMPFEAINLKAIDVRVIKIFENNIPQFLQENELDDHYQLKRVGRLIRKKKIDIQSDKIMDYGKWNTFSLDLSELIQADPGAIYRIEIDFKRSYSLYPCASAEADEIPEDDWNETEDAEISNWDNWDYYGGYDYYNWSEREDPCSNAYYRNVAVSRNILASNLGLIAKIGKDNNLNVAVTNIQSTEPLHGISLKLYSYQQQEIASATTDVQGMATIGLPSKPFLLVAERGKERGYLKLTDGTSLSLSKFDVGGSVVQKGVKGMIYGERGVWRPGDSIYVTFILEDKLQVIPDDHPVIFELLDPKGKLAERRIKTKGVGNFYAFPVRTKDDALTGNWTAKVRIGNVVFTKQLRIETVKPNRLKINIDFGAERLKLADQIKGNVQVKWLHGAIAGNLKAKVDMTLEKSSTSFDKYKGYEFDDPSIDFSKEEKTIFENKVDENGEALITASFKTNQQAPGTMRATFLTKVFEEGGDFSIDQFSKPCLAYDNYVGLLAPKGDAMRGMLLTDNDHVIDLVTVNADGEPISIQGLKAEVHKLQWRWWWASGSDNLASYLGRTSRIPIQKSVVNTVNGEGSFTFKIKYPDWGRYLVRVTTPDGHSCGKIIYVDWPGWAGRAQKDNPGGASMLIFIADKLTYKVGETAEVSFPSSEGGRALISIESGSKVLQQFWTETLKEQTKVQFDIKASMAPNIYVSISLIQPHAQTINDLPIRMYGIIPLMVHDDQTILQPVINMADELAPEKPVSIAVSEKNGRPMSFTLAVVDEGLLDLTRFKTPNPWLHFYAREALSVKTWDVYDDVFGAFGARIEQVFAIGGDQNILDDSNKKAKRFKPVVHYFGPYSLKAKEEKDIKFMMPRYIGSVKTMLVAAHDQAYGHAEKATPVKNPLMLLATLPRVLSPGEKVKLPVTLFALDEAVKSVEVEVKANQLFKFPNGATQTITFEKVGEKDIAFDLQVADRLGIGTIEVLAVSGKHKASFEIELDVRPPNPPKTITKSKLLPGGERWTQAVELFGLEGTNKAILEVSGMPPINLDERLRYLIRYPYGCIEQTTSSVFPQLYLNEFVDMENDFSNRIKQNVELGIERIKTFQLSDGGFSYWPGRQEANAWGTNYAGHFLLEAEKKGYSLPYGLKSNWLSYQKRAANRWNENAQTTRGDLIQAYRLYTLALANQPDLGSMNRLKESEKSSLQSKYMLALTYAISGNEKAAKDVIEHLEREIKPYKEWSYTYGSSDRDQAIVIETLITLDMLDEAMPMIKRLSEKLSSSAWMSTQTTAFGLRAMSKAAGIFKKSMNELKISYKLGSAKEKDVVCTQLINQYELDLKAFEAGDLQVENQSDKPLYISLSLTGTPLKDEQDLIEKNLKLSVSYMDMAGNSVNVDELSQGTDFMAVVKVKHPALLDNYQELALTCIFPSGWEIINTRLFDPIGGMKSDVPTYQDVRDDRVNTFFDLRSGRSKTFVFHLNAAYVGEYALPAIQCGAMYDDDIQARIPGRNVKVVKN